MHENDKLISVPESEPTEKQKFLAKFSSDFLATPDGVVSRLTEVHDDKGDRLFREDVLSDGETVVTVQEKLDALGVYAGSILAFASLLRAFLNGRSSNMADMAELAGVIDAWSASKGITKEEPVLTKVPAGAAVAVNPDGSVAYTAPPEPEGE